MLKPIGIGLFENQRGISLILYFWQVYPVVSSDISEHVIPLNCLQPFPPATQSQAEVYRTVASVPDV